MTERSGRIAVGWLAIPVMLLIAIVYWMFLPTKQEPLKPLPASGIVVVADAGRAPQSLRRPEPATVVPPPTSLVSTAALPAMPDDDAIADLPADLSKMEGRSDRTGPPTTADDGIGGRPAALPPRGEPLSPP